MSHRRTLGQESRIGSEAVLIRMKGARAVNHGNHERWSIPQLTVLLLSVIAAFALYPMGARAAQVVDAIIRDGSDPGLRASVDAAGALKVTGDLDVSTFPSGTVMELLDEPVVIDSGGTFLTRFHDTARCTNVVLFWSQQGDLLFLEPSLIMSPDGVYEADAVSGVQHRGVAYFPAFGPRSFNPLGIPDDFSAMPAVTPFAAVEFENPRAPTTLDAAWLYCSV